MWHSQRQNTMHIQVDRVLWAHMVVISVDPQCHLQALSRVDMESQAQHP